MRADASYDEPFAWWGPVWTPPAPRDVLDLIRDGTVPVETAALLWALLARRASVTVAAGPSGAGKTTLLTALLAFLPPGTTRLYLRGCYETFAFLEDPTVTPTRAALLVNEISAHLPAYLWGAGVRRALAATERGFSLFTTLHAATPNDLVRDLAGYPLRLPAVEIARLGVVVFLETRSVGGSPRPEVTTVTTLTPTPRGGLAIGTLAARPAATAAVVVDPKVGAAIGPWLGRSSPAAIGREIAARAAALGALAAAPVGPDPAANLVRLDRRWHDGQAGGGDGPDPHSSPTAPAPPW